MGREFSLSLEKFVALITASCHYCGCPPTVLTAGISKSKSGKIRRAWASRIAKNGIDRIDSRLGYVDGNVVTCCLRCNIAKGVLSYDDFFAWIDRAAAHLGLGRGWVAA